MTDNEIKALFEAPLGFEDSDSFVESVCHKMSMRQNLRQAAIMASGGIGGLYALGQIVRMPNLHESSPSQTLKTVVYSSDSSMRFGAEIVESFRAVSINWLENGLHTLNVMQSPHFFWLSFAISLAFLGVYFAYTQEETI